jgi:ABC-type Fe3+ transport system substrate-binding protein
MGRIERDSVATQAWFPTAVLLRASLALAVLVAACAAPAPTTAPSGPAAAQSARPKFDALVAKARAAASNEVTGYLEASSPAFIRFLEDKWKEQFGFSISIGSVPGHGGRDGPVQVMAGFTANAAIVDMLDASTPQGVLPAIEAGAIMKPDWEALAEGFPLVNRLREGVPPFTTAQGEPMSDYCMVGNHLIWTFVYNTHGVKPEEVQGLKLDDLTKPQWRNRVITDNQFAGIYQFPRAPGWTEERMVNYVKDLKANGVKAVPGGTYGVVQAVGAGQGDLAIAASIGTLLPEKNRGLPIEALPPADGWLTGLVNVGCVPRLTRADPALAQLFMAWFLTDGRELADDFEGTGNLYFSDSKNAGMDVLRKHGIDFSKVIYPATQEDLDKATRWRKLAIDTFTGQ